MFGWCIGIYGLGEIGCKIVVCCVVFESEVGYFSRIKYDMFY